MSQQISPVSDGTGKSKQTAQSSRTLWMAHWMRNSTSTERRNPSPHPQQEELDRISKNGEPNAFEAVNDDCLIISPKSFDKAIDGSKIPAASNELSLRGFRFFGEGPSNSQHIVPYNNNNNNNNSIEKYEPGKGKAAATSINDTFGRHWFQKRQGVRFLSAQTEDEKLNSNKKSEFDLETMRICTTVDSVQAVPGGCPRFSQTTHSLLITKKTDANQENDLYRGAAQFVKRTNENASRDLKLSPFFRQSNRGVKIQPLSSSSNSQGRNNVEGHKVTIKNESSAETDTMEMDFCKEEKLNYGANSTPSAKALNINSNPPHRWINSRLPNTTNRELHALPGVESPPENVCLSSSRTQSLEMDMLLDNAEHHARTKPNLNPEDPDPSNPWVKRLKMSSPNSSSQGTKISSNPTEYLSHDKMRRYFKSILDSSVTDSDPSPRNKDHGKETIVSDKNGDPSKEGEEFMVDMVKKNDKEPSLLSHVWIKRWLRNGPKVAEQKPDQAVEKRVRGPLDDDDELEKKQFPSIGAMAMMGKAMAGFQSCEVQKRGSFTVWNSKQAF